MHWQVLDMSSNCQLQASWHWFLNTRSYRSKFSDGLGQFSTQQRPPIPDRGSRGEQQKWELGSRQPPVPAPHAQQTRSFFMSSAAMGPRISGYFLTCSALKTAAQMLMQQEPVDFSSRSSLGHEFWLRVHPGVPQLNFPRSGLSTLMKVPGMGPNRTPRLWPSTLLKSQKSGEPEPERVSSTRVDGDCPVMPLHSIPKLLRGAPQSPVSQTNLSWFHLQPVRAQNRIATVLAFTCSSSWAPGAISHPLLESMGTPKPPIQIFWGHWFLKRNRRMPLKVGAEWASQDTHSALAMVAESRSRQATTTTAFITKLYI